MSAQLFFMNKKFEISKEFLIEQYIKNEKTLTSIAKMLEVSTSPIISGLKKYHIPMRTMSESCIGKHKNQISPWKGKKNLEHSKRMMGKNNPMFGTHPNRLGKNNPMFGRNHTIESCKKVSFTRKMRGCSKGPNNPFFNKFGPESSNWHGGKTFEWKNKWK